LRSITRARIQVRSVRSRLEGDDVGFIRVTQFNEQTTEGLKKALAPPALATARLGSAAHHCDGLARYHELPQLA
jgi:hypothetical protein